MPGVKAILPTLRRRLSTGDIFKPARKLVRLFLHIRKDFITRVASKNVWVILAPSNGLIAIMNWFQKVSLNEMSGKVLTSPSIAVDALQMAIRNRQPRKGLIHHSDRGIQYACNSYRRLLQHNHLVCSMSRKGDCWDNSPA